MQDTEKRLESLALSARDSALFKIEQGNTLAQSDSKRASKGKVPLALVPSGEGSDWETRQKFRIFPRESAEGEGNVFTELAAIYRAHYALAWWSVSATGGGHVPSRRAIYGHGGDPWPVSSARSGVGAFGWGGEGERRAWERSQWIKAETLAGREIQRYLDNKHWSAEGDGDTRGRLSLLSPGEVAKLQGQGLQVGGGHPDYARQADKVLAEGFERALERAERWLVRGAETVEFLSTLRGVVVDGERWPSDWVEFKAGTRGPASSGLVESVRHRAARIGDRIGTNSGHLLTWLRASRATLAAGAAIVGSGRARGALPLLPSGLVQKAIQQGLIGRRTVSDCRFVWSVSPWVDRRAFYRASLPEWHPESTKEANNATLPVVSLPLPVRPARTIHPDTVRALPCLACRFAVSGRVLRPKSRAVAASAVASLDYRGPRRTVAERWQDSGPVWRGDSPAVLVER